MRVKIFIGFYLFGKHGQSKPRPRSHLQWAIAIGFSAGAGRVLRQPSAALLFRQKCSANPVSHTCVRLSVYFNPLMHTYIVYIPAVFFLKYFLHYLSNAAKQRVAKPCFIVPAAVTLKTDLIPSHLILSYWGSQTDEVWGMKWMKRIKSSCFLFSSSEHNESMQRRVTLVSASIVVIHYTTESFTFLHNSQRVSP